MIALLGRPQSLVQQLVQSRHGRPCLKARPDLQLQILNSIPLEDKLSFNCLIVAVDLEGPVGWASSSMKCIGQRCAAKFITLFRNLNELTQVRLDHLTALGCDALPYDDSEGISRVLATHLNQSKQLQIMENSLLNYNVVKQFRLVLAHNDRQYSSENGVGKMFGELEADKGRRLIHQFKRGLAIRLKRYLEQIQGACE